MMKIETTNQQGVKSYVRWTTRNRFTDELIDFYGDDVTAIEADKEELIWIINTCVNLPHHRTKEKQKWTGDLARFIFNSLPSEKP